METFTAYTPEGVNQFTFDSLIKDNTYQFLHFVPIKGSPKKVRMVVSLFNKDNVLIEERDFQLEIDNSGRKYNEHFIGLLQNGMTQKNDIYWIRF
ncbi:hypothetical protein [Flavobacterium phycosphaerae]|uniref:hypothetical protein n=1 Tax=Flavobacterium phycosphaerae TaxID=2697515 RepID=UPI0013899DAE|nr:hypothetical protein [Flavobacterium phycosphaerae]